MSMKHTLESLKEIRSFLREKLEEDRRKESMEMQDYLKVLELCVSFVPNMRYFDNSEHQLLCLLESVQKAWDELRTEEAERFRWKYLSQSKQKQVHFHDLVEGQVYELDPSGDVERLIISRKGNYTAATFIGGAFSKPRTIAINLDALPFLVPELSLQDVMAGDLEVIAAESNVKVMESIKPAWVDECIAFSDHQETYDCLKLFSHSTFSDNYVGEILKDLGYRQ